MIKDSKTKKKNNRKKTMTKYLESAIKSVNKESDKDKSPAFKSSKDAMKWLTSLSDFIVCSNVFHYKTPRHYI